MVVYSILYCTKLAQSRYIIGEIRGRAWVALSDCAISPAIFLFLSACQHYRSAPTVFAAFCLPYHFIAPIGFADAIIF